MCVCVYVIPDFAAENCVSKRGYDPQVPLLYEKDNQSVGTENKQFLYNLIYHSSAQLFA